MNVIKFGTGYSKYPRGVAWGKHRENGVWFSSTPARRLRWKDHDSLFVALWRFRLRLMKP